MFLLFSLAIFFLERFLPYSVFEDFPKSFNGIQTHWNVIVTKKKPANRYASSSSIKFILRETTKLFFIDPMDYDESVWNMIKFISCHPMVAPLTKIPNPNFPLQLLHNTFERVKIDKDFPEVNIIADKIVPVHTSMFLNEIKILENPKGFQMQKPTVEEFQSFLSEIGNNGEFKAKELNKSAIPGLWTIFMHLILRDLSRKNMVV